MAKTPLLLVPGMLCSPRLYAGQLGGLAAEAEIVVPDWRQAPLVDLGQLGKCRALGAWARCRPESSPSPACRWAACWRSRSCSSPQSV